MLYIDKDHRNKLMDKKISKAALGRVSLYIIDLKRIDSEYVSATTIPKELNLGEVLVRKDHSNLCGNDKPKKGCERLDLLSSLESYLVNDNGGTIIVGAGKIGNALLSFNGFEEYGINILAAFDHHKNKEIYKCDKKIYLLDKLEGFIKENDVKIAIITVPENVAQETLDLLYKYGIRLFFCFAPIKLKAPNDCVIQYENFGLSLTHLKNSKL